MRSSLRTFFVCAAAVLCVGGVTLPYWTAPAFDASAPLAGIALLANASHKCVFFGSPEAGDYNHGVMIHYAAGIIHLAWKNGVGTLSEDKTGQVRVDGS